MASGDGYFINRVFLDFSGFFRLYYFKLETQEGEIMKIIIADDHAIVREGLKQILAGISNMGVCDEAADGTEAIEKIKKNNYDIAVLDIKMPGTNVLDLIRDIKIYKPEIPILILSMYPEEQYAVRVLKAGASGYLTKESAPKELISAILKISKGGKYISEKLGEQLAFHLDDDSEKSDHEKLSDREFQVFGMIASGKSVKMIAEKLNLSEKTVSTYRSRVLQKMNLKNNAELTHYAFKYGLVDFKQFPFEES
jgi:two-component system, NarL family, invasion response regulator UvrY